MPNFLIIAFAVPKSEVSRGILSSFILMSGKVLTGLTRFC